MTPAAAATTSPVDAKMLLASPVLLLVEPVLPEVLLVTAAVVGLLVLGVVTEPPDTTRAVVVGAGVAG